MPTKTVALQQWRVSWEVVTPFTRPDLFSTDDFVGPLSAIEEADWRPTEKVTDDEAGARQQYSQLTEWVYDGSEPIRNVRLESRPPGEWRPAAE